MNDSRERFEAYCAQKGLLPKVNGTLFEAWQAAEHQALEQAREAVDAEHLEEEADNPSDAAYQCAVDDCVNAIGALIEKSASKE